MRRRHARSRRWGTEVGSGERRQVEATG
jgi:hypothetical protein